MAHTLRSLRDSPRQATQLTPRNYRCENCACIVLKTFSSLYILRCSTIST